MEPTVFLTPEQIASYHENGFLSLPSISTPDEITIMRAAYDRIFASRAGRERGDQFDLAGADEEGVKASLPQILNPSRYAPELANTLASINAFHIARQLLGENAGISGDHAIFKPAFVGAETPWHQDEAYWSPEMDYNSLSVWVPLQDVTTENGCMQFIAGSHKGEVLPHRPIGNDPRVHGLELDGAVADVSHPEICPLPAGGATFHDSRTLHFTGANRSAVERRALIMGFGTPGTPRTSPRSFAWQTLRATPRAERAARAADASTGA